MLLPGVKSMLGSVSGGPLRISEPPQPFSVRSTSPAMGSSGSKTNIDEVVNGNVWGPGAKCFQRPKTQRLTIECLPKDMVVFSSSSCPFCREAIAALKGAGA